MGQELEPPLTPYTSPMKSSREESVCHIALLRQMIEGRWSQTQNGRPYPAEFAQLFNTLSKGAFFHSHLTHTRNQPSDLLYNHLQEKEFRSIWSWYESVMAFIEEFPALYFDLGLPQVQSRSLCEQQLQQVQSLSRTFSVRFASEEGVVSLSLFKRGSGCSHTKIIFKQIKQLIRYVLVLERYKFTFISKEGTRPSLFPQMNKLPMFKSSQPVRQEMNAYSEPVASISDAVASDHVEEESSPSNAQPEFTFPLVGAKRERSDGLDNANLQPQLTSPSQYNLADSQNMRAFFDGLAEWAGDKSFLDDILQDMDPVECNIPIAESTPSPIPLFQSTPPSKSQDDGNSDHPFVSHGTFLTGGRNTRHIPSSSTFASDQSFIFPKVENDPFGIKKNS